MFRVKDGDIWIKAWRYHSQKKHDTMHEIEFEVAIANECLHHVTKAACSCVAGKAGMCSHVIGVLKQMIYYVMMKPTSAPICHAHKCNSHGINFAPPILRLSQ